MLEALCTCGMQKLERDSLAIVDGTLLLIVDVALSAYLSLLLGVIRLRVFPIRNLTLISLPALSML